MTMTLDLKLFQQLDTDEPLSLEDIAHMVGDDEPGRLLVCEPCSSKRFIPADIAKLDRYARFGAVDGFVKLHGRCAPGLVGQ